MFCCGWMDEWVHEFNATNGPQLSAEAEFRSVELVSWGQVLQYTLAHLISISDDKMGPLVALNS